MALKDIIPQTETVEVAGTTVELHGLSLKDISSLLDHHKDALGAFFEAEAPNVDLVTKFQDATCSIIAHAADEPESEEIVSRLPIGDQLKLLQAVWKLTNLSVEDLGNMISGVLDGLRRFKTVRDDLTEDSKTG